MRAKFPQSWSSLYLSKKLPFFIYLFCLPRQVNALIIKKTGKRGKKNQIGRKNGGKHFYDRYSALITLYSVVNNSLWRGENNASALHLVRNQPNPSNLAKEGTFFLKVKFWKRRGLLVVEPNEKKQYFCTSQKKIADKSRFGPEFYQNGRVVDPGVFNQTIILLGLAGSLHI